ncbi:ArsR family transcriptional regulator [Flavobacterium sp. MFBS3-15]|uniref:ArsR family transcriptional regulator n=1 Tax=Flavobacterium sp. MFBS3-15 TaxID=2989816 RepID=UPI002236120F|nr:ArsR family transcriptional regulator [Flavobacterium sp. MFBS3-15]MCW4468936.1 ArsR family transcriptional regulator [Flavobacterium sp. MFBS3-15]
MKTKPAKACYSHLGGKLGTLLFEMFIEKGWIAKERVSDKYYFVTEKGEEQFAKLGIDLSLIKEE